MKVRSSEDVLIVSAWGRGGWLAGRLAQKGCAVKMLDVSSCLPLSSADREGPFGVFIPDDLNDLDKKYLHGDNYDVCRHGFCVMTPKGPVEFRGPLSDFIEPSLQNIMCWENIFSAFKKPLKARALPLKSGALPLKARGYAPPGRLFFPYVLRESSARFFQSMGAEWGELGVKREAASQIRSVCLGESGVCVKTEHGESCGKLLVWALNFLESKNAFPHLDFCAPHNFMSGGQVWSRFVLHWEVKLFQKVFPLCMLVWPHPKEGLVMTIKRRPGANSADLWVLDAADDSCLPRPAKTQPPSSIRERAERCLNVLFPGFSCVLESDSPPSAPAGGFARYDHSLIKKHFKNTGPGLFYLTPEAAGCLDAYSLFQEEKKLKSFILKQLQRRGYA